MKTIPELEAEYEAAKASYNAADRARVEARNALDDAKLEATGLKGHLVEFDKRHGFKRQTIKKRFVVMWTQYGRGVSGKVVKADGTMGTMIESVSDISVLHDLGIYEPKDA